ncbi:MAG: hypothetical protein M3298_01845 [Thermoproteota archaeon]|nr:hypothetical protein [Thermoproteota archaeon]
MTAWQDCEIKKILKEEKEKIINEKAVMHRYLTNILKLTVQVSKIAKISYFRIIYTGAA